MTRQPYNISISSSFPSFPCQSICQDYATKCSSFIATNPTLSPNCSIRALAPSGPPPDYQKSVSCDGKILTGGQLDFPADSTWYTSITSPLVPSFTHLGVTLPLLPLSLTVSSRCNGNSTAIDNPSVSLASYRQLPSIDQSTVEFECRWPSIDPRKVADVDWSTLEYLEGGSCALVTITTSLFITSFFDPFVGVEQVCPNPLYTEAEYDRAYNSFQALTFISWLLTLWYHVHIHSFVI
jgi:hypothetical protein